MVVSASSSDPDVDVTFIDEDGTRYGFILVGNDGQRSNRAINKTSVPRTPFKITTGEQEYSDFEFPFNQIAQKDWSGGSGQEQFENNRSRFRTSWGLNTWMDGRIILGPRERYGTGYYSGSDMENMPGSLAWEQLLNASNINMRYVSASISPSTTTVIYGVSMWIRAHNGDDGVTAALPDMTVTLRKDDGFGKPSTTVYDTGLLAASSYVGTEREYTSILYRFSLNGFTFLGNTLKFGSTYHIVVDGGAVASDNNDYGRWFLGTENGASGALISTGGVTWFDSTTGGYSSTAFDLYYRLLPNPNENSYTAHLFTYKAAQYFIAAYDNNDTPKLFRNGYRGVATGGQSAETLHDTTQNWAADELAGGTVYLSEGAGKYQHRRIIGNTEDTIIIAPTLSPRRWATTPVTGDTQYVVLGLDNWVELTGHGLTVSPVDVSVQNSIVWVTQGDDVQARRFRTRVNGTTFEDLGTTADTRASLPTAANGNYWAKPLHPAHGELIAISKGNKTISAGKILAWGSTPSLEFKTDIEGSDTRITGLMTMAGAGEQMVVFKEDGIWIGGVDGFSRLPMAGMDKVASPLNGRAHAIVGPYIYFSFLDSVHRLHLDSLNVDDLGPDKGSGLVDDRRGNIVDMLVYPGMIICAVDAGPDRYSSVMVYNYSGWHTVYKSHTAGERIRKLAYQHIPSEQSSIGNDRLWVSMGSDVLSFPFPGGTFDPLNDSSYQYTHEGVLDMSYVAGGLQDLQKDFTKLGFFGDNLNVGVVTDSPRNERKVYMVHREDTDSDWEAHGEPVSTGDNQGGAVEFLDDANGSANAVTGYRTQVRLIFRSDRSSETPRLDAVVLKNAAFVEEKNAYTMTVKVQDQNVDLHGDESSVSAETILEQLKAWSGAPKVLTMDTRYYAWGQKVRGYLALGGRQPFRLVRDDDIEGYLVELTLVER